MGRGASSECWLLDLSKDLRLDVVLDKTIESASRALPGREFALLVMAADELSVVRTSGLGPGARRRIESWARRHPDVLAERRELGELGQDEDLDRLALRLDIAEIRTEPFLIDGRSLGLLVVLAPAAEPLDDDDRDTLSAFAEQVAVALANAHQFQRLLESATQDALTGLANRREFERLLTHELQRSARYGEIFSLAMIDLDAFKELNDTHGHAAGDTLLRQAAATIDEACRGADIAARLGGDEFVLILPQTDQYSAAAMCERLRAEVETLADVSLSWGIAEYPTHGVDASLLMRAADAAMYASKPRTKSDPANILPRELQERR